MRKMVVAVIILCLIVWASLYEMGETDRVYKGATQSLERIEEYIRNSDFDGGKMALSDFRKEWEMAGTTMNSLSPHEETEEINMLLSELKVKMNHENAEGATLCLEKLRLQLDHINKRSRIEISNIL